MALHLSISNWVAPGHLPPADERWLLSLFFTAGEVPFPEAHGGITKPVMHYWLPGYYRLCEDTMTDALRKAFETAGRLPEREQDELAAAILEELTADDCWEATLSQSQDALARLADEALDEHRKGRTKALDPDAL